MAKPSAGAPYVPPAADLPTIHAWKALARGDASEDQQKRAIDWLVNVCAGTYDMSFRPGFDGDRNTTFAEGRRFVGSQVVKLINMPSEIMESMRKDNGRRTASRPGGEQPG